MQENSPPIWNPCCSRKAIRLTSSCLEPDTKWPPHCCTSVLRSWVVSSSAQANASISIPRQEYSGSTCPDNQKGHYDKHRVSAQVYRLACAQIPQQIVHTKELPQPQPNKAGQAIIWACVRLDGKTIRVEVPGIENEQVWVHALPIMRDCGKLEPQFPFPNGSCSQQVQASDLEHIHIYRDA